MSIPELASVFPVKPTWRKQWTNGDLYVECTGEPAQILRRHDFDIQLDLNINIAQASLGDVITVRRLTETRSSKIPAGTQPGSIR